MSSPSRRHSDRVSLTVLLEVSGTDSHGEPFKEAGKTLIVSRRGAMIVLGRDLKAEQQIHLQRKAPSESRRQSPARVINQMGRQRDGYLYSIEILHPEIDLWGVDFPALLEESDAVAKMLLECTYCHGREVAYLSEIELRAFETNRGIARHCKTCRVPSIWTQVLHEDEKKLKARAARTRPAGEQQGAAPTDGEQRERQRLRLQTRLTACIRKKGEDDELAVCEDISPIGMCFRSKRRFDTDTAIEVAVPYSPDAANIFLPARIVYSEEIPKAGLFRHGTEYRKVGPRAR
jgi:PilZ domain